MRQRGRHLNVRITDAELKAFKEAAKQENRSLSNWIRSKLQEASKEKPLVEETRYPEK